MSVFVDWEVNRGDIRVQLALLMFRTARRLRMSNNRAVSMLGRLFCGVYLVIVEWTWGIELPWATSVGQRLRIFHGTGIVVHAHALLGEDVILRQGVCVGERQMQGGCPVIGDGVEFGVGAMVLGNCSVGDGARIGAGAVVLKDVPPGSAVVGNPARIL